MKPSAFCVALAYIENQAADAFAHVRGMRVHGANARGVRARIEQRGTAAWRAIAAVKRGATAPAAAAGDAAVDLDHVISLIGDQLRIQTHEQAARGDLSRIEIRFLQLGDRGVHERADRIEVGGAGAAMREQGSA